MINVLEFTLNLFSGAVPFCLTLIVGGYLTFKTRFFQFRNFGASLKLFKGEKTNGISGFSAMCNSLSAAIGTGNIVGVAAAIALGGAGAVFWMWVSSFLGMVIKAGEIALGVFYREKTDGGPHIYIKNACPKGVGFLAIIFAVIGVLASLFCGNMTQINAAVSGVSESVLIKLLVGVIAAFITGLVICGGTQKIARFLSGMLPFMAVLYIALCLGVIFRNFSALPNAFKSIFWGAFYPKSVTGGAVGSILNVISIGASKGIFSNEAGVGTAAIAHSAVLGAKPFKQSLYGIFEVFIDTTLLCTLTALTILTSGVIIEYNAPPNSALTVGALSTIYGNASSLILNAMLLLFGVSSVIGWASYGISFCRFLFQKNGERLFVLIYPFFCVLGSILSGNVVWRLAELFNGVLVIINLCVMAFLSKKVITLLKEK